MLELLTACQRRGTVSVFQDISVLKDYEHVFLVTLSSPGESTKYLDFLEEG